VSVEAISWALEQKLDRSTAKFVLVAMANCAGPDMLCWPSTAYLCEATCQDRKTVLANIQRLQDQGFIVATKQRRGQTGQVVVYQLLKESQKRDASNQQNRPSSTENGPLQTVPKTDGKSTENGRKESQKRTETVPKTGHGTVRNRKEPEIHTTPDGVVGNEGFASSPPSAPADDGMPPCPHQAIIDAFHAALPMARHVREWTPATATALRARWREKRNRQRIEWWRDFFAYVARSRFLTGQVSSPNRRPFELGLDWLLKAENFAKVIEGAYHEAEEAEAA